MNDGDVSGTATLTLEEISAAVARRLGETGLLRTQQPDRRVSTVPDARTIRYYTTIGLLDRPEIDGRTARYGRRHVLQLLAIKALQGEGLPLAEIQARLYGRSDRELEAIVDAAAAAISARARAPSAEMAMRPVAWREMTIEPGLKILAEEGWSGGSDPGAPGSRGARDGVVSVELLERIRAALAALSNGGPRP